MASYEKIIKTIIEKFQNALSPLSELSQITHNQELLIDQTQQIIDLLKREYSGREEQAESLKSLSEDASSPETTNEA